MVLRWADARLVFAALASIVVLISTSIVRSTLFLRNPTVLALAVTCDLLMTIPVLYYLLIVRTRRGTAITLLPVFLACLTVAKFAIPGSAQQFLRPILLFSAPLEITSLGLLILRLRRAARHLRDNASTGEDWLEQFQKNAQTTFPDNRLLDLLITELSVVYFGLCGWFLRRREPVNATETTCCQKGGWSALVFVLAFMIVAEGSIVHIVIAQWNPIAAWVWNAFDVYALLWLFADYHALRLRPLLLTDRFLTIRLGLRWSAEIPLDKIASCVPFSGQNPVWKRANFVKLSIASEPEVLLMLTEPVAFTGLLGIRRQVQYIGIAADNPQFLTRLEQSLARQQIEKS